MLNRLILAGLALALLAFSGCSKKDESGGEGAAGDSKQGGDACGAASVVADGKEIEVKKSLVVFEPKYKVTLLYGMNHTEATCDNAISGRFQVPKGGLSFRLSDSSTDAVGFASYTHMGGDVNVTVNKKGEKPGDKVELCIAKVTFKPNNGAYKDKEVTIGGKFVGEFCGEMKQ